MPDDVQLDRWRDEDRALLGRLLGDPAMMENLGGVESEAKIDERQRRYVGPGSGCFAIVAGDQRCGWVGVWAHDTDDAPGLEMGWSVLLEHQGRGLAQAGARLALAYARQLVLIEQRTGIAASVAAYPSVANGSSNRICERIGMTDLGERAFEYPPGHTMRCREWRLDLGDQ